jgi:hypothetical protein
MMFANALSVFIGSFIYSIVAMVCIKRLLWRAMTLHLVSFTLLFCFHYCYFLRWLNVLKAWSMGIPLNSVEDATASAIKAS